MIWERPMISSDESLYKLWKLGLFISGLSISISTTSSSHQMSVFVLGLVYWCLTDAEMKSLYKTDETF